MQKAKIVLSIMNEKINENKFYTFNRIYRNFFNEDFYYYAINSLKNKGIILKSGDSIIKEIINDIKNERYDFIDNFEKILLTKEILNIILSNIYSRNRISKFCLVNNIKANNFYCEISFEYFKNSKDYKFLDKIISMRVDDSRFNELLKKYFFQHYTEKEKNRLLKIIIIDCIGLISDIKDEKLIVFDSRVIYFFDKASEYLKIKDFFKEISEDKILFDKMKSTKRKKFNIIDYEIIRYDNDRVHVQLHEKKISNIFRKFTENNKPCHIGSRINLSVYEIVSMYKADYYKVYNKYAYNMNVSKRLRKFKYVLYLSLLKTIALKEKTTVKKIRKKYNNLLKFNK